MIRNINAFGLVLFGLLTLSVMIAIISSAKGAELVSLERRIKALENENRELESIVVGGNSLKKIAEDAPNMGLMQNGSVIYWNENITVANLTAPAALPQ